jgi:phosphatidate cytidylyltransferase
MLKSRLITAAFLIAGLFIALFYTSTLVWSFIALAVMVIGAYEWSRMTQLSAAQTVLHVAASLTIGLLLVYFFNTTYAFSHELTILFVTGFASFIWLVIVPLVLINNTNISANKLIASLIGIALLSAALIAFIGLYQISPFLLLGVFATVSIADSAAYFSGKQFGKHKLAPSISPGKTWEGVIGGMVAVSLLGLYLNTHLNYGIWLIVGLMFLAILSVMGDLFESKLKRQANLKDSGHILPGHGGILDRIDGIIPTTTLTLFYLYLPLYFSNGLHV